MDALQKTILALDNMEREEVFNFLEKTQGKIQMAKIGLELFCKYGPQLIQEVHNKFQVEIFLDLKLHDIPNTVKKAVRSLENLPIRFLTIHLSGGEKMISEALEQAALSLPKTEILGVSFLTSLGESDLSTLWAITPDKKDEAFLRLFDLAKKTKIHGIVLSPQELLLAKPYSFTKVCPGIRFLDDEKGDQMRIKTPADALKDGANYLVIGRPLTSSKNLDKRLQELSAISC